MAPPILLAVPNISEGREEQTIASVARALTEMGSGTDGRSREVVPRAGVRLLDVHSDRDHHRSVFTLSGTQGPLVDALLAGAGAAIERIDVVGRAAQDGAEA